MKVFAIAAIAMFCAWLVTALLPAFLQRIGLMDVPNQRSSHRIPTPRGGGLGILAGIAAALAAAAFLDLSLPELPFLLAAAIIAACGLWDDAVGTLPASLRGAIHIVAAAIVLYGTGPLTHMPLPEPLNFALGPLAWPLSILWIAGVVNIYNFLDGIDGFAGAQGLVAGMAIACMGFSASSSVLGVAIAGGCFGFLIHNWHPAKIFMGDVGSTTLGFLLATLPFQLEPASRGTATFCVAMCLWYFLSDGAFTVIVRLARGETPWEAHRTHLYQLLVQGGMRHDAVVLQVGMSSVTLAAFTVLATRTDAPWGYWAVALAALLGFVLYHRAVRIQTRQLTVAESMSGD